MTGIGWFVNNVQIQHRFPLFPLSLLPCHSFTYRENLQFWMQPITIIAPPVRNEFNVETIAYLNVAKYVGLVLGSSVWPMTADFIVRRLALDVTLLIASVAGLVGAGSPNFAAIATFRAFIGMRTGGNQPVDSAIFLEFIPATHQYLLTMQSAF